MYKSLNSKFKKLMLVAALATVPVAAQADSVTAGAISTASVSVMVSALAAGWDQPVDMGHVFYLPAYSVTGVIVGVAAAGVGTIILLDTIIDGSHKVLKLTINGLKDGPLAVGHTIKAVSTQAGHVLLSDDEYLGFAPNETGQKLLYSKAVER
ncbi:MAG: hypothetical protein QF384_24455 [Alphaproteobacteria bacterium]|jgi:hypothetical protein|nr:hypothetical protein [Alphaproteobacteria bacterium]MDP6876832.1 hypothetical protein [Alphaproteobacteria bacterium]